MQQPTQQKPTSDSIYDDITHRVTFTRWELKAIQTAISAMKKAAQKDTAPLTPAQREKILKTTDIITQKIRSVL